MLQVSILFGAGPTIQCPPPSLNMPHVKVHGTEQATSWCIVALSQNLLIVKVGSVAVFPFPTIPSLMPCRLPQSVSFHIFEFVLGLVIAAGLVALYLYKSRWRFFDRNRQKESVEVCH